MFFRKKNFELSPRLSLSVGRTYTRNQLLKVGSIICLLLAAGLMINAIRLIINQKDISTQGEVLGASDIKENPDTKFISYEVQKGDTLFSLSQKFNVSWVTLANLNNLKSPFTLKPGQIIQIPKP